ncbi:MAG TPA: zf-HC2 domain-containing protein [Terriglobia bacterium]|nr:zf-HC2 domain-containing protein [Terriglobia bacterium]
MDCRRIQDSLFEHHQNRLSGGLTIEVRHHLDVCPECRSLLESLKLVDAELDRFGEITSSPYFDQKLNVRIDELARQSWYSGLFRLLRQPYVLSSAFLLLATVSLWIGIRHQQAARLKNLEDVIRVQEKYLGSGSGTEVPREASPHTAQHPVSPPEATTGQSPAGAEQVIPDQDRAVIENFDLLENYETLKNLDLADSQASTETN